MGLSYTSSSFSVLALPQSDRKFRYERIRYLVNRMGKPLKFRLIRYSYVFEGKSIIYTQLICWLGLKFIERGKRIDKFLVSCKN